jgi:hypothetical protein
MSGAPAISHELLATVRSETDSASGGGNNGTFMPMGRKWRQEEALRLFELL